MKQLLEEMAPFGGVILVIAMTIISIVALIIAKRYEKATGRPLVAYPKMKPKQMRTNLIFLTLGISLMNAFLWAAKFRGENIPPQFLAVAALGLVIVAYLWYKHKKGT